MTKKNQILKFISVSFNNFLRGITFVWSFWLTRGFVSISSKIYEPPWRSNPKLTFLLIRLLFLRFKEAKKIANNKIKYIDRTLIFVKLSTKKIII